MSAMAYFLLSVLAIIIATTVTAKLSVARWPGKSARSHIRLSAMTGPFICLLAFLIALTVTLIDSRNVSEPGGTVGMVIFALVMFLFYGLVLSVLTGLPAAMLMVRVFKSR
jgi:hypothetical protein